MVTGFLRIFKAKTIPLIDPNKMFAIKGLRKIEIIHRKGAKKKLESMGYSFNTIFHHGNIKV